MPICLDSGPSVGDVTQAPVAFRESDPNCLDIGLVNNMPTAALESTERQFRSCLREAADRVVVRLVLIALPNIPRDAEGRRHLSEHYSDIRELWDRRLDGLIVTGAEPRTANLKNELYWGNLTGLLDWAEDHTHSTVCSCLAAHAAVLHIDGIARRPLAHKRFGVFECARISDHRLTAKVPIRTSMPHSRWNEIPEESLAMSGYRVLTRSNVAGADAFIKQRKSLFVFFQGHPEYEAGTLLLEYRRDIGRFLRGDTDAYPDLPLGYFDQNTIDALSALREQAVADRREALLAEFPVAVALRRVQDPWRSTAVSIYRSWLQYLCEKKRQWLARQHKREFLLPNNLTVTPAHEQSAHSAKAE